MDLPAYEFPNLPAATSPWLDVLNLSVVKTPTPKGSPITLGQIREYLAGDVEKDAPKWLECPQVETGLVHHFSSGIYLREAIFPAGTLVIGHIHREECLNICLAGEALVKIDGVVTHIKAPCILRSAAGTRKFAYVIKELRWLNTFATTETDPDKMIDLLAIVDPALTGTSNNQKSLL